MSLASVTECTVRHHRTLRHSASAMAGDHYADFGRESRPASANYTANDESRSMAARQNASTEPRTHGCNVGALPWAHHLRGLESTWALPMHRCIGKAFRMSASHDRGDAKPLRHALQATHLVTTDGLTTRGHVPTMLRRHALMSDRRDAAGGVSRLSA